MEFIHDENKQAESQIRHDRLQEEVRKNGQHTGWQKWKTSNEK